MALSFVAASSAWVSGTGAVTPTAPAGLAVGDLVVLVLVSKYENAVLPSDPAGWDTPGTPAANTGRPTGNDNGNTRMRLFYRVWQSGDTMPSLSPTPNNVSTVMAAAYRSGTGLFDVVAVPLADDTVGTPLEVVTPAIALAVGDHLLTVPVVNGDAPTWGTTTVTAPGITFGAATSAPADASTTAGTDLRMRSMTRAVTAGTASAAVTVSTALAGTTTNAVGTVAVVRVREQEPTLPTVSVSADPTSLEWGQTAVLTATATGLPAPTLSWALDGGTDLGGSPVKSVSWATSGVKTVTVTATNSAGSVQNTVQVTVTEPLFASISTLKDNFASGYAGKWPGSYGTIATANGEATIQRNDPSGYSALHTDPTKYDCRNGEFVVKWGLPGPGAGGREFGVELRLDANNYVQFYCTGYPSNLSAVLRQGGVTTYPGQVALPAANLWVKFSITNSVVTYSYSTNRINWTTLGTSSPAFNMNGLSVHMIAGAWQPEGAFDCTYGYVNTVPGAEVWNGTRWVPNGEMWNGTSWRTDAEIWNGSRWVPLRQT